MKKDLVFSLLKGNFKFVVVFFYGLLSSYAQNITIPIETKDHALVLQTDNDKRLRNIYFGKPLKNKAEYDIIAKSFDFNDANAGIYNIAYTPSGTSNLSEPALQVKHADGNTSLELK
ncbi:MAG: hypothetical protein RIR01_1153, partial [Bacteroidota bacterium]